MQSKGLEDSPVPMSKTEADWCNNSTVFVQKGVPAPTVNRLPKSKELSKSVERYSNPMVYDKKKETAMQWYRR